MKRKILSIGLILSAALTITLVSPKENSEASGFWWKAKYNPCVVPVCIEGCSSTVNVDIGAITTNTVSGISVVVGSNGGKYVLVPGTRKDCVSGDTFCWSEECKPNGQGGNSKPGSDKNQSEPNGQE